ncbi:MAG: hypothetical protein AB8E87_13190 [Prochlorococcus sp.]|nr:hypothetical protein [Prochlorococcaceae cyanobacterium Fu_MAG_50]
MTALIPLLAARDHVERLKAYSAPFPADTLIVGLDLLGLPVLKRM